MNLLYLIQIKTLIHLHVRGGNFLFDQKATRISNSLQDSIPPMLFYSAGWWYWVLPGNTGWYQALCRDNMPIAGTDSCYLVMFGGGGFKDNLGHFSLLIFNKYQNKYDAPSSCKLWHPSTSFREICPQKFSVSPLVTLNDPWSPPKICFLSSKLSTAYISHRWFSLAKAIITP